MDVIIPTKNSASTLEACLKSLRKQTMAINIIIVDANSTDATRQIAKRYDATIFDEPKSNIKGSKRAVACNEGLKHSSSHIVAFLDSDSVVSPDWAQSLSHHLQTLPHAGAVTSGCAWKSTTKQFSYACHLISQIGSTHAHSFTKTKEIKSVPGFNSIYLRSAIDQVGGFDQTIGGCEDLYLNLQLRKKGWKLYGIPRTPVTHRQHHTPKTFAKQMYSYAWSRGHLLKTKHIFTPLHALPSLALIGLIIISLLFPPYELTFFKSIFETSIPHSLFEKLLEAYLFLVGLWSFILISKDFTLKLWLQTISAFIIQHLSWAVGYLKGLMD